MTEKRAFHNVNTISVFLLVVFAFNHFSIIPTATEVLTNLDSDAALQTSWFYRLFSLLVTIWFFASNGILLYGSEKMKVLLRGLYIVPFALAVSLTLIVCYVPLIFALKSFDRFRDFDEAFFDGASGFFSFRSIHI